LPHPSLDILIVSTFLKDNIPHHIKGGIDHLSFNFKSIFRYHHQVMMSSSYLEKPSLIFTDSIKLTFVIRNSQIDLEKTKDIFLTLSSSLYPISKRSPFSFMSSNEIAFRLLQSGITSP
jgi:hypothetical protein